MSGSNCYNSIMLR